MAHIISLGRDPHEKMRKLLPWYVTGRLDAEEIAALEAHLADCLDCTAELEAERALGAQVAGLPMDMERGWSALRERIKAEPRPVLQPVTAAGRLSLWRGTPWLVGAQAAAILLLGLVVAMPRFAPPAAATYHALGAAPVAGTGNIVVMFRPETRESDLRGTLGAVGARVVDGPTAAGGYLLRVPDATRDASLVKLRARADVVLAQPIDAGATP